jgi:hypothetical protein
MANEREDKIQTDGRKDNAAQPLNAADKKGGPERYPAVRQDDAVEGPGLPEDLTAERRSFDPPKGAPSRPPQGAGDTSPASTNNGRLGPAGDPAEGKP